MKIIIKSQLRSQRFRAAAAAVTLCAFRAQKCSKSTFQRKLYLMLEVQCLILFSLPYFHDLKGEFFEQKLDFLFECAAAYNGKLPEEEAAEGAIRSANEICLGLGRSNADATTQAAAAAAAIAAPQHYTHHFPISMMIMTIHYEKIGKCTYQRLWMDQGLPGMGMKTLRPAEKKSKTSFLPQPN